MNKYQIPEGNQTYIQRKRRNSALLHQIMRNGDKNKQEHDTSLALNCGTIKIDFYKLPYENVLVSSIKQ